MRGVIAALLLAGPVSAAEAPAWEGYWAEDLRWCARGAGQPGEETPDWYGRDGLFGLEWSCDITSVTATGVGQSWALQLDCLDAGYAYKDALLFQVTWQDRLHVITADGEIRNFLRCEGGM
ncbi:MAG: hypothetical protein ACPG61_11655 [Paracoccaceae bacterium]|jgi:hypothetical protein